MQKKGFTLIELLVVIAIIGILTSVVLASLNSARSKGGDAGVKDNLSSIRTQAEVYYDTSKNYGATAAIASDCNTASSMFVDDANIKNAIAAAISAGGGTAKCSTDANPATKWAVAASLKTNSAMYWCVDSSGMASSTATAPASGACVFP